MDLNNRTLVEAIRGITNTGGSNAPVLCKVNSVSLSDYTCECEPVDESGTIHNVKLNADASKSFVLIPSVDSYVMVTMTSEITGFVSMVSLVDNIYLRGDTYGGLIKIDDLKIQYDSFVTGIKTACAAGFTAIAGLDGGASLAAFNASASSILPLNKTTLENQSVRHGNI